MEDACANCKCQFPKRKGQKGYERRKASSLMSPRTYRLVYRDPTEHFDNAYICFKCKLLLESKTVKKRKHCYKRIFESDGDDDESCVPEKQCRLDLGRHRLVFKRIESSGHESQKPDRDASGTVELEDQLLKHLRSWHYVRLLHTLVRFVPRARLAIIKVACQYIRKEVMAINSHVKDAGTLGGVVSLERLEQFKWDSVLGEAQRRTPTLLAAIQAAMPQKFRAVMPNTCKGRKGAKRLPTKEECLQLIKIRTSFIISVLYFTKSPTNYKFVQSCIGLELWRQGLSQKGNVTLQMLGITQNRVTIFKSLDRLAAAHDVKLLNWKQKIEASDAPGFMPPKVRPAKVEEEDRKKKERTMKERNKEAKRKGKLKRIVCTYKNRGDKKSPKATALNLQKSNDDNTQKVTGVTQEETNPTVVNDEVTLMAIVAERSLTAINVPGDGNCFFHAVSEQHPLSYTALREKVSAFMKENETFRGQDGHTISLREQQDTYNGVLESWGDYTLRISKDGTEADFPVIVATSRVLNKSIRIHCHTGGIIRVDAGLTASPPPHLLLGHRPHHFYCLKPFTQDHSYAAIPQVDGPSDSEVHHNTRTRGLVNNLQKNAHHDELCGIGFCWDNIQLLANAKHQGSGNLNKLYLWGNTYAKSFRVPSLHLTEESTIRAVEIDPLKLIPSSKDYIELRRRMIYITKWIIIDHLQVLEADFKDMPRIIPHKYFQQMNRKSEIVNLGVVDANPSSTQGTITILRHIHQYFPTKNNGSIVKSLVCGDGASVEKMKHAKRSLASQSTPQQKCCGVVECPGEFHAEGMDLQDTIDNALLFRTVSSPGTLAWMKDFFFHKNVKSKVMENFQHVWDLLKFSTEGYVMLYVAEELKMDNVSDVPKSYPCDGSKMEKETWLELLAVKVVDFCFQDIPQDDIRIIHNGFMKPATKRSASRLSNDDSYFYCWCGIEKGGEMILCCNGNCSFAWFHKDCVMKQQWPLPATADQDWYCSAPCQSSEAYVYCVCKQKKKDQMVQCASGESCKGAFSYHIKCIGMKRKTKKKWYCSKSCRVGGGSDDGILNYSKFVMFRGLRSLVIRDATRSGDGEFLITKWRLSLLDFWKYRHPKYLMIAHQFLTGVAGFECSRLITDLTWNRLCNLKGKHKGNVGDDWINELLNLDFTEMVKRSNGQLSAKHVSRCSKLSGGFGRHIDELFDQAQLTKLPNVAENLHKIPSWYKVDICNFVKELKNKKLLEYVPGQRYHCGMKEFSPSSCVQSPYYLGQKLRFLSQEMDKWRKLGV